MTRTIGIDLDGTLVDSMPSLEALAIKLFYDRYGMDLGVGRALYRQTCGVPFREQVNEIFPGHPENANTVVTFENTKEGKVYPRTRPFGYAGEVLRALPGLGWRPVLISATTPQLSAALLKRLDLEIDIAIGSSKVQMLKTQDVVAFIGDTHRDARAALQAGALFLGVRGMFPDMPYATLADVAESALGVEHASDLAHELLAHGTR